MTKAGKTGGFEFLGARASNAGDEFHELWATRSAIRLLDRKDDLQGVTVEGVAAVDVPADDVRVWDGVDCTLYFGGQSAADARHIRIEQLKYSAAAPKQPWTVSRLVAGDTRQKTVLNKLARSWAELRGKQPAGATLEVALVSNQPIDPGLRSALGRLAAKPKTARRTQPPKDAADAVWLAWAINLTPEDCACFLEALKLDGGAGSGFAIEERALAEVARWSDEDVLSRLAELRRYVRGRMGPQPAGEVMSAETIVFQLGAGEYGALFPCPSDLAPAVRPIARDEVDQALKDLKSGRVRRLCLHGQAGVGKTTALAQLGQGLPPGSEMVVYDCYGGGRYLDSDALRHRPTEAFLQLTNELAARLDLPLLVVRKAMADPARVFASRLRHAAGVVSAAHPEALLVIAVDAADNAVAAGRARSTQPFIQDFLTLGDLPDNVRLVVSARTGRLPDLALPRDWTKATLGPFQLNQTAELVARRFKVSDAWLKDFHELTGGVPRVETYALRAEIAGEALDRLLPAGKSLGDVFHSLFEDALKKSGAASDIARMCAGLIALPRPIPMTVLAEVIGVGEAELLDFCGDLAPAVRAREGVISFADEDFEDFVREEGRAELATVRQRVADKLLESAKTDRYAAEHVASALHDAGRFADLLDLVEAEAAPVVLADPIVRRAAELTRLRLAIRASRTSQDRARALKFILVGAEGQRSERSLAKTLRENLDLSVRFASGTLGRLVLAEGSKKYDRISTFYQRLLHDAERGDTVSGRENQKLIQAYWENFRSTGQKSSGVTAADILAHIDAASRLGGASGAVKAAKTWQPARAVVKVAAELPFRLVTANRTAELEKLVADPEVPPSLKVLLRAPLLLKGAQPDPAIADELANILPWLRVRAFYGNNSTSVTQHGLVLDLVLTCCELLARDAHYRPAIDDILREILRPEFRRIDKRFPWEAEKLDLLLRAWALSEQLAGRVPIMKAVFEPRQACEEPKAEAKKKEWQAEKERRQKIREEQLRHDEAINAMVDVFSDLYLLRAEAFHSSVDAEALKIALARGLAKVQREEWRLGREHGSPLFRALAARSLLALASQGQLLDDIADAAMAVHGGDDLNLPNLSFFQRISLWPEQHDRLIHQLSALAVARRNARIGAEEKSKILMTVARYMLPLSKADAAAVFNDAINAAAELDSEILQQLELIHALIGRAGGAISDSTKLAGQLSEVATDAGIRLEDVDQFPWAEVSRSLAALDPIQALAACARWDDADLAIRRLTLGPMVSSTLESGGLTPMQAAALYHLLDEEDDALTAKLDSTSGALREEMAWDRLMRWEGRGAPPSAQPDGPWTASFIAQRAFVDALGGEPGLASGAIPSGASGLTARKSAPWAGGALSDPVALRDEVLKRVAEARARGGYGGVEPVLAEARDAATADRVGHLKALAALKGRSLGVEAGSALFEALNAWRDLPSVAAWRRSELRAVIVDRLPDFTRYIRYADQSLDELIALSEMDEAAVVETLLEGIEAHVDVLDGETLFGLAQRVAIRLPAASAATLAEWFVGRLYRRIPATDRENIDLSSFPATMDDAVARCLFAYMGDIDVRLRWRAAHALRRLARLGDTTTLGAMIPLLSRRHEPAFRYHDGPFYWLAARQWAVLAWARVASERPLVGALAARALLGAATDAALPHLLIQLWAKDACLALASAGAVQWSTQEVGAIQAVGTTPLPRKAVAKQRGGLGRYERRDTRESRRFDFDGMDTLPYWYDPVLRCFASLRPQALLEEAERWILDEWGYPSDPRELDKARRRRARQSEWSLYNNGHGSNPTIEDLRTYLEWNALWTAAGGLLAKTPLRKLKDAYEESWEDLTARARRDLLSDPPGWATDFRTPIPLLKRNWAVDRTTVKAWVGRVTEAQHRAELEPADRPDYLIVQGHTTLTREDRVETTSVSSALVGPTAGSALIRALQMMEDSWDYKLPDEGEDWEITSPPFRLLGWLAHLSRDPGMDEKDPFRGQSSAIRTVPGRGVTSACRLVRDASGGSSWASEMATSGSPMFVHEAWGETDPKNEWYGSGVRAEGRRLLVHREQLQDFLAGLEMDLIVEVEIKRNDREGRRQTGAKAPQELEGRYDRLYRLDRQGGLHIAEGHIGTWRRLGSTARRVPP